MRETGLCLPTFRNHRRVDQMRVAGVTSPTISALNRSYIHGGHFSEWGWGGRVLIVVVCQMRELYAVVRKLNVCRRSAPATTTHNRMGIVRTGGSSSQCPAGCICWEIQRKRCRNTEQQPAMDWEKPGRLERHHERYPAPRRRRNRQHFNRMGIG